MRHIVVSTLFFCAIPDYPVVPHSPSMLTEARESKVKPKLSETEVSVEL